MRRVGKQWWADAWPCSSGWRDVGRTFPHISTIVDTQKLVLGGTKNKLLLLIPLGSVHVSQISIVGCYLMGPHCSHHCLRLVKWRTCLCSCCQFTFHPHNIIIAELLAMGVSEYQGHIEFIWKLSRSVLIRKGRSFRVEDDGAAWAQPFLCFQDMLKKCKCECNFAWSKHPEHKSSCGEEFNWTHNVFRQKACMQIILISAKGKNRKKFWNIIDAGGNKDVRKSIRRQAKVQTTRVYYKPGNARKLIFLQ